jgi:hypothetical protein
MPRYLKPETMPMMIKRDRGIPKTPITDSLTQEFAARQVHLIAGYAKARYLPRDHAAHPSSGGSQTLDRIYYTS